MLAFSSKATDVYSSHKKKKNLKITFYYKTTDEAMFTDVVQSLFSVAVSLL